VNNDAESPQTRLRAKHQRREVHCGGKPLQKQPKDGS
jgi:hypothetical protein